MSDAGRLLVLLLAAALVTACSQKKPAAIAIDAAESALAEVHEEAQKYIPEQYAEVKARLDEGRRAFSDERYDEALAIVKGVPARARELGEAAAAAREELAAEINRDWARLTESMPGLLAGLESRLAELGKVRRLPEGVTADAVEHASSGLDVAREAWSQAGRAFESGNLEGAVARALESERLVRELLKSVGIGPAADTPPAS